MLEKEDVDVFPLIPSDSTVVSFKSLSSFRSLSQREDVDCCFLLIGMSVSNPVQSEMMKYVDNFLVQPSPGHGIKSLCNLSTVFAENSSS